MVVTLCFVLSLCLSPVRPQTLRSAGKFHMLFFVLLVFPGCFFAVSLLVAAAASATGEQEEARAAEARRKEEEFSQIVEVLKKREEMQVRSFSLSRLFTFLL